MKHLSSQIILTNTGAPLKRGIITCDDNGTILNIDDTGGDLKEKESVEFHNGIIVPGFVNCHCHLELSHLKSFIPKEQGLPEFIRLVRNNRDHNSPGALSSIYSADEEMYREGIVLCGDICNTPITFDFKKKSRISYISLIEVFGVDPEKAGRRMDEIIKVAQEAEEESLPFWLVPHSVYSLSLPLFRLLREKTGNNRVTSIHFFETEAEISFLSDHSGNLIKSYEEAGLLVSKPETPENHSDAIMNEVTSSGNLILVHNTFADRLSVRDVKKRGNTYWCLCPSSNLYIENKIAPVEMLISEDCDIVIGTDSLASNDKLSILSELKILQDYFPSITLSEMIRWATLNGARAFGEDKLYGTIEPGKRPGLLLLENIDMKNMKLLPESNIKRLL